MNVVQSSILECIQALLSFSLPSKQQHEHLFDLFDLSYVFLDQYTRYM